MPIATQHVSGIGEMDSPVPEILIDDVHIRSVSLRAYPERS